mmetsp:Transcript_48297/g.110059  ORF Transcript_48297/g.110059 Transcript_48297/m.110059 type:complete len:262 (+) Transcript_48297:2897-3682(+)
MNLQKLCALLIGSWKVRVMTVYSTRAAHTTHSLGTRADAPSMPLRRSFCWQNHHPGQGRFMKQTWGVWKPSASSLAPSGSRRTAVAGTPCLLRLRSQWRLAPRGNWRLVQFPWRSGQARMARWRSQARAHACSPTCRQALNRLAGVDRRCGVGGRNDVRTAMAALLQAMPPVARRSRCSRSCRRHRFQRKARSTMASLLRTLLPLFAPPHPAVALPIVASAAQWSRRRPWTCGSSMCALSLGSLGSSGQRAGPYVLLTELD